MARMRLARLLPVAGFAAVVCGALGLLVGVAVRPLAAPADLAAAPVPDQAEVTAQQFADQHTVPVRFTLSRTTTVSSPGAGRVTATSCRPGRALRSGGSLGRLDDTPVLALATSMPLYRDLAAGAKGRDVRSLQRELVRLGFEVRVTGYYGSMTTTAVRTLQRRAGALAPTGRIAVDRLVWLPRRVVTPTSCDLRVGDQAIAGAGWAKVKGGLSRVDLQLPTGLLPGKRTAELYGVRTALSGTALSGTTGSGATLTDPEFLAAVAKTPEFAAQQRDGGDPTASVRLSTPLDTLKVPPAALFGIEGRHACVESGEQVVAVRIVGSGLGASLVTSAVPLGRVDLGPAITATACGEGS